MLTLLVDGDMETELETLALDQGVPVEYVVESLLRSAIDAHRMLTIVKRLIKRKGLPSLTEMPLPVREMMKAAAGRRDGVA